jgi:hypothetical protein
MIAKLCHDKVILIGWAGGLIGIAIGIGNSHYRLPLDQAIITDFIVLIFIGVALFLKQATSLINITSSANRISVWKNGLSAHITRRLHKSGRLFGCDESTQNKYGVTQFKATPII